MFFFKVITGIISISKSTLPQRIDPARITRSSANVNAISFGGGRGIFSFQYSIFLLAIFNIPTFNIPIPTFIHLKYSFYFLCIPIFILNNSVVVIVYLFILIMACFMFLDSLSANRMKITRNICKIRII